MVFGEVGGHGLETLTNYIYYSENGFEGVVWVRPLFCHPEACVEPAMDILKKRYKIPLLTLNLDDNISEINLDNRLEAFVETLNMRK